MYVCIYECMYVCMYVCMMKSAFHLFYVAKVGTHIEDLLYLAVVYYNEVLL